MSGTDELLSAFDVDEMATEALLFQTGYLTIAGEEDCDGETVYRLEYPNREVRQSLNGSLLRAMTPDALHRAKVPVRLRQLLRENDFEGLEACSGRSSPAFPTSGTRRTTSPATRGYYASVFYSWFASAGLDVRVEESTSQGRLDMAVLFNEQVYLFEFKTVEMAPEGAALAQIKEKGYADKYRHLGQPIYLVGVEFSRKERNVAAFAVERA